MSTPTTVDTYEARFARLQEVVLQLESGEIPLDRAITLYEEGVRLAAECQTLLDTAELRIQQLQSGDTLSDLAA
ncbi:MAG: exodeoxyribonuclease VII small subunit [Oscillochloris sp.]|nr:exodeoxyribonuclease VII small subunit [Oscillochloris sp.]